MFILFLLMVLAMIAVARPLTCLLHELGHAVPAVLLTRQKVTVFIGSHGNLAKSLRFSLGLLEIHFRYNPLDWETGLCIVSATTVSIRRQIVYTTAGPLTSLLLGGIAVYFAFSYNLNDYLKLFMLVFMASAVYDLIINLRFASVKLYDGSLTYSDGLQLKMLLGRGRANSDYYEAIRFYKARKYADAAGLFEKVAAASGDDNMLRLAMSSYQQLGDYEKVIAFYRTFEKKGEMTADDYTILAGSLAKAGQPEDSLRVYDTALGRHPGNSSLLNNKGYQLNLLGRFAEAVPFFDLAIGQRPDFAYAYNNRGLAKIRLGQLEVGLQDVEHSIKLEGDNAYGFMNLGVYHAEKGDRAKALELFVKAKSMDPSADGIDLLLEEAGASI